MKGILTYIIALTLLTCSKKTDTNSVNASQFEEANTEIMECQNSDTVDSPIVNDLRTESTNPTKSKKYDSEIPLDMRIDTDTRRHTVTISGGIYLREKTTFLSTLRKDVISHYIASEQFYDEAIACDFENGRSTIYSSQPKAMHIIYNIDVFKNGRIVDNIDERWIAGKKGDQFFSDSIQ